MVKSFRKRYLAFQLYPALNISKRELFTLFMKNIIDKWDKATFDDIHLRIIKYNRDNGLGILRCDHQAVQDLSVALTSITETTFEFNVSILGVSGTIKALKRKKSVSLFI
ncbi:MAG: hypothetical protein JSV76_01250 [Candidatus Bathyarchaeota archaeon]|nr:MAG: hypothetical protein JSV76_01250 [Candidatus Bathyarchaeota archaeon]